MNIPTENSDLKEISTNPNGSKRANFLEHLFYIENKKKPDSRAELSDFIKKTKIKHKKLFKVYKIKGGYDIPLLLIENQKTFGLEDIPYEKYNAIIQNFESLERKDFDNFYNLLGEEIQINTNAKSQDNIKHTIESGGEGYLHALGELVGNAKDAVYDRKISEGNLDLSKNIGRFGKGFFQIFSWFSEKDSNAKIIVDTKKEGNKPLSLIFSNKKSKLNIYSKKEETNLQFLNSIGARNNIGTSIKILSKLEEKEQSKIIEYLKEKFSTNTDINYILNGKKINNIGGFKNTNGNNPNTLNEEIEIIVNKKGVEIIDNGIGMNAEDLSGNLLYPSKSSKRKEKEKKQEVKKTKEELEKEQELIVKKQANLFFSKGKKGEKTKVNISIGGFKIESFNIETFGEYDEVILDLPSTVELLEDKNKINATKLVVMSLKKILEDIGNSNIEGKEKLKQLEILGLIGEKFSTEDRKTTESSGKNGIANKLKKGFEKIKNELEEEGNIILPGDKVLKDIFSVKKNILFVHPLFVNLDFNEIPNIKEIDNISDKKLLPFYTIDFSEKSKQVVLVTDKGILIDKRYLQNDDKILRATINSLINYNVGYEIQADIEYHGYLSDGKLILKSVEKKEKTDFEKNNVTKEKTKIHIDNNPNPVLKEINKKEINKEEINKKEINEEENNEVEINLELDIFKERLLKIRSSLLDEFNLDENISTKSNILYGSLNDIDLLGYSNVSEITDEEISFYLLSCFPLNNNINLKNKYISILGELAGNGQEALFEFGKKIIILTSEQQNKYLSKVLELLEKENFRDAIIEQLEILKTADNNIFKSVENISDNIEEQVFETVDPVDLFKTDKILFLKILGKKLGTELNNLDYLDNIYLNESGDGIVGVFGKHFIERTIFYEWKKGNFVQKEIKEYLNSDCKIKKLGDNLIYYSQKILESGKIGYIYYIFKKGELIRLDFDNKISYTKQFGNKLYIESFKRDKQPDNYKDYDFNIIDEDGKITNTNYGIDYKEINGEIISYDSSNDSNILFINGEKYEYNTIYGESFQEHENGFYCTVLGQNNEIILLDYITGGEILKYPINLEDKKYEKVLENIKESIIGEIYFTNIKHNSGSLNGLLNFNSGDVKREFELDLFIGDFSLGEENIEKFESGSEIFIFEEKGILYLKNSEAIMNVNSFLGNKIISDFKTDGKNQALFETEDSEIFLYDGERFTRIFRDNKELGINNFHFYNGKLYSIILDDNKIFFYEGYGKIRKKTLKEISNVIDFRFNDKKGEFTKKNSGKGFILGYDFNFDLNFIFKNGEVLIEEELQNEKIDYGKIEAPLSAINFVKFIKQGGEFLKPGELLKGFDNLKNEFKLSELIGARRLEKFDDIFGGTISGKFKIKIDNILNKLLNKEFNKNIVTKINQNFEKLRNYRDTSLYEGEIISSISGQDSSSQIWIRELLQNCIDVTDEGGIINIDFFADKENKNFVTNISDSKGMSLEDVFTKLLPLGTSGKKPGEGQGMFGQGFYSSAINSKKINIKTSIGDGITTYVTMNPNVIDGQIYNFDISYNIKKENFKGTIVERIDKTNGIEANFNAMIGTHNIVKYSGLVKNMDIFNNGTKINLDSEKIFEENDFSMLRQGGIERLTKGGLYISDFKDEFLDYLPDFIIKEIKKEKISINIPNKIDLVSSRAGFKKKYLEEIKLNIFNLGTKFVLKQFMDGKIKLPMNPEDFLAGDFYYEDIKNFPNSKKIINLAEKVSNGEELKNISDIELLKNSEENMILFLLYLEINIGKEKTSLAKIKEKRDNKEYIKKLNLKGKANTWVRENIEKAESINTGMESGNRKILNLKEVSEEINLEEKEIEDFLNTLDEIFGKLTQELFNKNIKNNIYKRFDKDDTRTADYGFNKDGIYMNWNIRFIKNKIEGIKNIEGLNDFILTMTHELNHLLEDGIAKFGTHEQTGKNSFAEMHKETLRAFANLRLVNIIK